MRRAATEHMIVVWLSRDDANQMDFKNNSQCYYLLVVTAKRLNFSLFSTKHSYRRVLGKVTPGTLKIAGVQSKEALLPDISLC